MAARPLICRTLLVVGALVGSGCYRSSVSTKIYSRDRSERRVLTDERAPLLQSSWRVEPGAIVGQLDIQQCQTFKAWTRSTVRTTEREVNTHLPWIAVGMSFATSLVAAATWENGMTYCDGRPVSEDHVGQAWEDCNFRQPDNTLPKVLLASSLAFTVAGTVALFQQPSTTSKTVDSRHGTVQTEPCIPARDLAELLLVVRRGSHLWPLRLTSNGEARIPLPQTPEVPRDVDLELVVYRAPRMSGGLLTRGAVLDTFRVELAGPGVAPTPSSDDAPPSLAAP